LSFFVISDLPAEIACLVVLAGWIGFGLVLVIGKSRASRTEVRREAKSRVGFLLQCAGYAIAIFFPRTFFSPIAPMSKTAEEALAAVTIAITIASVCFCLAAAWALGKQWALVARLVESHELIVSGPYAVVRNPIYLAMLGMMLATGLAVSRWEALVAGTVVFLIGNSIRIRSEEKLLRGAFGTSFDEYARRVPAFLPRLF
jgi:protein-S-isoprenylcysteine O-methyltransferase Ste14